MQREAKTERMVVYVTPAQKAAVVPAAPRLGSRGAVVRQARVPKPDKDVVGDALRARGVTAAGQGKDEWGVAIIELARCRQVVALQPREHVLVGQGSRTLPVFCGRRTSMHRRCYDREPRCLPHWGWPRGALLLARCG